MRRPSLLVRLLRRSGARRAAGPGAAPAEQVSPGARREQWLVVGVGAGTHHVRAVRLAEALADRGLPTTFVARDAGPEEPSERNGLACVSWSLPELRRTFTGGSDRLRVLLGVADAETIALARDLGAHGARVAYDAPSPAVVPAPTLSYDAETEQALVDAVEDLVGADKRTARHLSAQAGGGRLVHVIADPESPGGWGAAANVLVDAGARPSAVVLLATGRDRAETLAAARAFEAARGDGAYRLVVIASGASDPAGEALDEMEEGGTLRVLRSARPGRAAAWNLGLSATRSEIVVFAHASQRPDGAGWLAPALAGLTTRRELGAVGTRSRVPLGAVGEGSARAGPEALRVAALDGLGLVAHRSVLRRVGGFDESADLGELSCLDLSFRIRDLGLGLELCPDLGLRGGEYEAADTPGAERALRARWSSRPAYLAGRPGRD